jgi:hypothetical protein
MPTVRADSRHRLGKKVPSHHIVNMQTQASPRRSPRRPQQKASAVNRRASMSAVSEKITRSPEASKENETSEFNISRSLLRNKHAQGEKDAGTKKRRKSVTFGAAQIRVFDSSATVDLGDKPLKDHSRSPEAAQAQVDLLQIVNQYNDDEDNEDDDGNGTMDMSVSITGLRAEVKIPNRSAAITDAPTVCLSNGLGDLLQSAGDEDEEDVKEKDDFQNTQNSGMSIDSVILPHHEFIDTHKASVEEDLSDQDNTVNLTATLTDNIHGKIQKILNADTLQIPTVDLGKNPDSEDTFSCMNEIRQLLQSEAFKEEAQDLFMDHKNEEEEILNIIDSLAEDDNIPENELGKNNEFSQETDREAPVDDSPITIAQFYELCNIKFLGKVASRKTGSLALPISASMTCSSLDEKSKLRIFSTDYMELNLLEHACAQLDKVNDELTESIVNSEEFLSECNPQIFREAKQTNLTSSAKSLKSVSKLEAQVKWYVWKAMFLDKLLLQIQQCFNEFQSDKGILQELKSQVQAKHEVILKRRLDRIKRLRDTIAQRSDQLFCLEEIRDSQSKRISSLKQELNSLGNLKFGENRSVSSLVKKEKKNSSTKAKLSELAFGWNLHDISHYESSKTTSSQLSSNFFDIKLTVKGKELSNFELKGKDRWGIGDYFFQNSALQFREATQSSSKLWKLKVLTGRWNDLLNEITALDKKFGITFNKVSGHLKVFIANDSKTKGCIADILLDTNYPQSEFSYQISPIKCDSMPAPPAPSGFRKLTELCNSLYKTVLN